jgi:hypothetical protein
VGIGEYNGEEVAVDEGVIEGVVEGEGEGSTQGTQSPLPVGGLAHQEGNGQVKSL